MLIPVPVVPRLSRMVSYKLWQISEISETEVCREGKLSENGGEQLCLNKAPCLSLISNGLYPSPSGTVTSKTFTPSGITGSDGWGGAGTSHSLIILCFPVVTDVGCNKWNKKRRKKWFGEGLDGSVVFLSALARACAHIPSDAEVEEKEEELLRTVRNASQGHTANKANTSTITRKKDLIGPLSEKEWMNIDHITSISTTIYLQLDVTHHSSFSTVNKISTYIL